MPLDARLSTTLPSHPKTKKLIRRHGPGAAWSLVCLFLWAAGNRSDGNLAGMTDEDIELAADWAGEPGVFVKLLVDVGFLDGLEDGRTIHDWAVHNPWAAGAEDRSIASKWAALCKRYGRTIAAERMPEYAERMRPAREPYAEPMRDECPVSDTVSDTVTNPPSSPQGETYPQEFLALWGEYPSRGKHANPQKQAFLAFEQAMANGAAWEEIVEGAKRFASDAAATGKLRTEFIPQLRTWLDEERWKDQPPPSAATPEPAARDDEFWRKTITFWQRTKIWPYNSAGPQFGSGGCEIPAHIISEFNLDGMSQPPFLKRSA